MVNGRFLADFQWFLKFLRGENNEKCAKKVTKQQK